MNAKPMTPAEFYKKVAKEDRQAIINLSKIQAIDIIPTGSWVLNLLIGDGTNKDKPGGLPRGHIVEVFGDESSGKTTMALSACKQVQDMSGVPVFIDYEWTFNEVYAQRLGINLDPNSFIIFRPNHFQHGMKFLVDTLVMRPPLIVVDSVSAMTPQEFLEGSIDEGGRIGLQAQLMSMSLSYLTKVLSTSNTCLLFTNQLRSVIKTNKYDPGPNEESSGGKALRFYSSVRIKMQKNKVESIKTISNITGKTDDKAVNITIKAKVVKNKIDTPYKAGPLFIRFGEGFDNIASIVELAVNTKVIKQNGSIFVFELNGETIIKVQGKEQLRAILEKDADIFNKLKANLKIKQDEQTLREYKNAQDDSPEGSEELDTMFKNVAKTYVNKDTDEKPGGDIEDVTPSSDPAQAQDQTPAQEPASSKKKKK